MALLLHYSRPIFFFLYLVLGTLYSGYFIERVSIKHFPSPLQFYWLIFFFISSASLLLYSNKFKLTLNFKTVFWVGILMRFLLFLMEPNLSDDYFRYIWDGRVTANGLNPYLTLPSKIIQSPDSHTFGLTKELYNGFNSPNYYSVYPPFVQFIYALVFKLSGTNIYHNLLTIRSFILIAEISSLFFLKELIKEQKQKVNWFTLYALNPFIIIEFVGNLHTEVFMVTFVLGALYFMFKKQYFLSGLFWGIAVVAKLLPAMLLLFLFRNIKFKRFLQIGSTALFVVLVSYAMFWDPDIYHNIKSSLDLYFGTFQFNAGLIYLIRWIGLLMKGWDITFMVMPVVAKTIAVGIIISALFYKTNSSQKLFRAITMALFLYYFSSAIIHPWYLCPLIPLGILAKWRFPFLWVMLASLSYSAYLTSDYQESPLFIGFEYCLLLIGIFTEFMFPKFYSKSFDSN